MKPRTGQADTGASAAADTAVNTAVAADGWQPRRVLIVSAAMGEGHNATGKALAEAIGRLWPDARIRWVDVLDAMGYGSGPLFRKIYATSVQHLPWAYEFFYDRVWRYRWFARAAKRVIGAWSGRRLGQVIDDVAPDLIMSTYPMASTGLEWLREHRGLGIRTGAWVSDFAPHPSWVHAGVDLNLVMHEVAVPYAVAGEPRATVAVSAPPVSAGFQPRDRQRWRREWNLPESGLLAVVSCGSLGFGKAEGTVAELLEGTPRSQVVVVAGRNTALRRRLETSYGEHRRVRILGWVEDMAGLFAAADVVVTNAGGATFLEAMASGRTVLMHDPIAGHGRANAELMAAAGLARVCTGDGALAAAARELWSDPELLREGERTIDRHLAAHRLEDGLHALRALPAPRPERALRAEDALFVHVQTATVPQQVGTVLMFEPADAVEAPTVASAAALLAAVPGSGGYLRPATGWRRARWCPGEANEVPLVDEVKLTEPEGLSAAIDEFFAEPLPDRRSAAARLLTGLPDGGTAILVKLHHALGDGITVLRGLLSGADDPGRSWATPPVTPVGTRARPRPKHVVHGLWNMARSGTAPAHPSTGPVTSSARHYERLRLPANELQRTARHFNVTGSELLHAVFAEAMHRSFDGRSAGDRLRVMVPWSLRGTSSLRAAGNSAGVLAADLPIGPMPLPERVERVAAAVRECADGGMPELAGAVVRALGKLPPPLHRVASRLVYRSTWFNAIGTVLPGPRWDVRVHGTLLTAAYPVLPLAPGIGLSWGALTWRDSITVCFTASAALGTEGNRLADAAQATFDELVQLSLR